MARLARLPDGETWLVRRLWLPRLRRRRDDGVWNGGGNGRDDGDGDGGASGGLTFDVPDDLGAALIVAAAVVVVTLVVVILLPYIFFLIELAALPLLFAYRILFRRPWTVEARPLGRPGELIRWRVVGWRRSAEVVREVAAALERGERQPQPAGVEMVRTSKRE